MKKIYLIFVIAFIQLVFNNLCAQSLEQINRDTLNKRNESLAQEESQEFLSLLKIALKNYEVESLIKDHESRCIPHHTRNDRFIINDNIPFNFDNIKYSNKTLKFLSRGNAFYCQINKYGIIENFNIESDKAYINIKFFDSDRINKGNKLLIGNFYFEKKKKWKLKNVTISK